MFFINKLQKYFHYIKDIFKECPYSKTLTDISALNLLSFSGSTHVVCLYTVEEVSIEMDLANANLQKTFRIKNKLISNIIH